MPPLRPRQTLDRVRTEQDVYTAALERCRRIFELFDHVAVSFSGGKDSTAVLNVALEVARELGRTPLRVVFYDEEAIPLQTVEYVRRVAELPDVELEWLCVPIRCENACSRDESSWYPWAPEDRERWVRELPPEAITELPGWPAEPRSARLSHAESNEYLFDPAKHGRSVLMLGIRAQESLTRLRMVTRREEENYLVDAPSKRYVRAYPVFDWETTDVWTAPARFGWDYNRAYDRMAMAGLSAYSQRCSNPFGNEPLQKLYTFATAFPEIWDKMLDRVPGVPAAYRYALTELYGYGKRPPKPEGVRWGDFLLGYVANHDPDKARNTAERLRFLIRNHFRKTSEPLVVDAPHPDTGISWDFLLMVAMRGDAKQRKQAGGRVKTDPAGVQKARERYEAELARYRDSGRLAELSA